MEEREAIPPGTLDMLILRTLAGGGEMHGFEIAQAIRRHSEDVVQVEVRGIHERARALSGELQALQFNVLPRTASGQAGA